MKKRVTIGIAVALALLCGIPAARLLQKVECPFCHAGKVDAQGRCELGDRCGNYYPFPQWDKWTQEERDVYTGNPGHFRAGTCWWCNGSDKMTKLAILMD